MFNELEKITQRPELFEFYTAADLWTDDHISKQMLACHLNTDIDVSSRRGKFVDQSVEWISSYFNVGPGTSIADFGCGPGLYTNRLAMTGASITGIDFSRRSIKHARAAAASAGLKVAYVNRNYLEYETEESFDIILMIMCDFCALSPAQRSTMLDKFYAMLTPGGSVLLDAYSLNAFESRKEVAFFEENLMNGFWSPEKYFGFQNTFKYLDASVVLDKYTIVEVHRTGTVYNWLQYFSPESLGKEFENAGFTRFELFGNVAGAPLDKQASEFAVVGKKN